VYVSGQNPLRKEVSLHARGETVNTKKRKKMLTAISLFENGVFLCKFVFIYLFTIGLYTIYIFSRIKLLIVHLLNGSVGSLV
jgi:hypothetical protein